MGTHQKGLSEALLIIMGPTTYVDMEKLRNLSYIFKYSLKTLWSMQKKKIHKCKAVRMHWHKKMQSVPPAVKR